MRCPPVCRTSAAEDLPTCGKTSVNGTSRQESVAIDSSKIFHGQQHRHHIIAIGQSLFLYRLRIVHQQINIIPFVLDCPGTELIAGFIDILDFDNLPHSAHITHMSFGESYNSVPVITVHTPSHWKWSYLSLYREKYSLHRRNWAQLENKAIPIVKKPMSLSLLYSCYYCVCVCVYLRQLKCKTNFETYTAKSWHADTDSRPTANLTEPEFGTARTRTFRIDMRFCSSSSTIISLHCLPTAIDKLAAAPKPLFLRISLRHAIGQMHLT